MNGSPVLSSSGKNCIAYAPLEGVTFRSVVLEGLNWAIKLVLPLSSMAPELPASRKGLVIAVARAGDYPRSPPATGSTVPVM